MKRFGPGLLVTAAFIGPGTLTTSSVAGANYGFALLWTLLFSVLATIVLQEMAARLGLVGRQGLSEALRTTFQSRLVSGFAVALVVAAIALGTAAFETGNIMGAAMGLEVLTGTSGSLWALMVGAGAFALLAIGVYKVVEKILVVLVVVMSLVFVATAVLSFPDLGAMLRGAFVPSMPDGSLLTVIALIGTTVVPYNLFLHSSSVSEKWSPAVPTAEALREARWDTGLSIGLGGLITLAVLTTAAQAFFAAAQGSDLGPVNAATMATQLEPTLGPFARHFFAIGLVAAGLTSAITAPLAAAYATCGALGWSRNMKGGHFRAVWAVILVVGTALAATGTKPVAAILFAQAANGILLPITAVFLLFVMNRRDLLGEHVNGKAANLAGVMVVLVATGLGGFQLLRVLGLVAA
jgi:NRAMP (natural resistance-associated macrophage protein)-like metal ion transporter